MKDINQHKRMAMGEKIGGSDKVAPTASKKAGGAVKKKAGGKVAKK